MKLFRCLRKVSVLSRRDSRKKDRKTNHWLLWIAASIISIHLIAAAVFYGSVLSGPPNKGIQDNKYQDASTNSLEQKRSDANTGINHQNLSGDGQAKSVHSQRYDSDFQEYVRASRDLYAQEGMWRAANFLAVVGTLQFVFGIPALVMIWQTLRATRDTLKETQIATEAANRAADAAESAERAYIFPEICIESADEIDEVYAIKIKLTNCGKTPAVNVVWSVNYINGMINNELITGSDIDTSFIAPNEPFESLLLYLNKVRINKPIYRVRIDVLYYEDVFGRRRAGDHYLVATVRQDMTVSTYTKRRKAGESGPFFHVPPL